MKSVIPVFFAADDNYLPFLAVALQSIRENASTEYAYRVHVLHAGLREENARRITAQNRPDFFVEFNDVSQKLAEIGTRLHMRDYYTGATYYRIFIADMFPQYDKALYLDSDITVLGDIAELYRYDLGRNLVGAIPDETVLGEPVFRRYVREALGVPAQNYFNAGILLMNLRAFRKENFYGKFHTLLAQYKFTVAQDQDYLNVLCRDRVRYLPPEWNKMPMPSSSSVTPKLIHYNLTRKPWHYANVLYREHFWHYAAHTDFYDDILRIRNAFTPAHAEADAQCEKRLISLAEAEADRPDNYYRSFLTPRKPIIEAAVLPDMMPQPCV